MAHCNLILFKLRSIDYNGNLIKHDSTFRSWLSISNISRIRPRIFISSNVLINRIKSVQIFSNLEPVARCQKRKLPTKEKVHQYEDTFIFLEISSEWTSNVTEKYYNVVRKHFKDKGRGREIVSLSPLHHIFQIKFRLQRRKRGHSFTEPRWFLFCQGNVPVFFAWLRPWEQRETLLRSRELLTRVITRRITRKFSRGRKKHCRVNSGKRVCDFRLNQTAAAQNWYITRKP